MTTTFDIDNHQIQVDIEKTKEFYVTQQQIVDDCKCEECNFYATKFITEKLEIFNILNSMGVDLSKNLSTEPTGVWCIRDDNENFIHCQQVYQIIGKFVSESVSNLNYENIEKEFKVSATFSKVDNNRVDIAIFVDKLE